MLMPMMVAVVAVVEVDEVEKVVEDREVEGDEVVAMLVAPGGLACPSAPALLELLLPRLSRRQRSAVVGEARRHLPTLVVHRPSTLLHLLPLLGEEVEALLPSLLPGLLEQPALPLLAALLPLLAPPAVATLASTLLHTPSIPAASVQLLLATVPQHSAALALFTEAIIGRKEVEGDLVEALVEKGGEEVEVRLAGGK